MRNNQLNQMLSVVISAILVLVFLAQPIIITAEGAINASNHAPGAPYGLLTNESEHPMNVEGAPMFDWWVIDEDYDEVQTAYQIRVFDGITDALVWDSGKVASSNQNCVPYTGDPLKPGYPYTWEVRTWDSEDAASPYSERAEFSTGLATEDWNAKWIQGIQEDVESPLSISTTEIEDVLLNGEGFALKKDYTEWDDYELTARLTVISGAPGVAFRTSIDGKTGYVWQLVPGVGLVRNKVADGKLTRLGTPVTCEVVTGKEYSLTISAKGDTFTTSLDGTVIDAYTDSAAIAAGTFGFYTEAAHKAELHSLTVTPTEATKELKFGTGTTVYNGGIEWTDYTMEFDMVIHSAAAGIMLRAANSSTGYMWQFNLSKGGLARHIRTGASKFTKIDGSGAVKCTLVQGQKHHVAITIAGNVITTYLDGVLINTYTDANSTYMEGGFALRQGNGESCTLSNIVVTGSDGTVLCDDEANVTSNYSAPGLITVTESIEDGYATEFSTDELAAWVGTSGALPIKNGTQTVYWGESIGDGVTLLNYGLDWTDYTLTLDVQVIKTSAGIVFRAPDASNSGYMWAVRSDNKLRLHKGENNKYSRIGTTAESDIKHTFAVGETYHVMIKVSGETITTYINGVHINTRTASISNGGSIGFRTDSNESGRYSNVVVTDPDGNVLFADDFSGGALNWGTSGALNADNSYWYSRKEVKLGEGKQVKKAIAYVSGSQDYELSVNGVRIGRAQTYDYPGETRYQGWDITDAVVGKPSVAIGALTSYFGGAQGRAISKPGLLGKFIIYYTDGTCDVIVTDETWLTHATGYSNLGNRNSEGDEIEYCDARLMLSGWTEIGYDTSDWLPVILHGAHPTKTFYNLVPEIGHVEEERVSAVSVTTLSDGTTVADFGKIIPARVIIHFPDGTAGTVITVQEGYQLNSDGSINTSSDATQSTNMTYVYTMKDGKQTFEAWGYLGFRYVSVPAAAGTLTAEDFEATILHAETVSGRESTLDTSSEMLDQVFELMKRSALYSVQNQFVDTPTREKGQFLYDAINISAATMSGSYERQMTRKAILQFLASSDRHWSDESTLGMYTAVYPNNDGARDIPEFSLNVPLFVWRYYMLTGDRELLEFAYPYMKNTAGYVTRNINEETGLVTAIQGGTSSSYKQGIIDTPPDRFGYDWSGTLDGVRTTINAHCVRVYDVVAAMSLELGYTADAELYNGKADALRAAMNEYLITESGIYCDGLTPEGAQSSNTSQHATSHAIVAGAPSEDALDAMVDYIASLGMRQGTTTADILLAALFESGRADAAVKLLTNTNDYGWAKIISKGGTFIWENWHGSGSQSHGWGAASLWQVIEHISAVEVIEAGAKTIRIAPSVGAIDSVESHTVTARGAVDISYSGDGKDFVITIEVPANMTAEVVFPLVEDGEFTEIDGRNGNNRYTDDSQIMTVGSGKRTFKYAKYTDIYTPEINTASVTVGSSLAMNYSASIPRGYSADMLKMEFTMNGRTTTVSPSDVTEDACTFVFTNIPPQCMGDSIGAKLYSNGKLVDTYEEYSVKAYAEDLLSIYGDNEQLTQLVTDMLNYGAAAQAYVGHKTDTPVNAGLETAGSTAIPTVADRISSITTSTDPNYGFTSVGVRFDYVNKIFVKLTIGYAAAETDTVTVLFNGKEAELKSLGGVEYIAYSGGISALDFAKEMTVTINVNGSAVQTLTYSVNSYVYAKHDKGNAMADLALALYRYGLSAVAYDASHE